MNGQGMTAHGSSAPFTEMRLGASGMIRCACTNVRENKQTLLYVVRTLPPYQSTIFNRKNASHHGVCFCQL
eukprot:scaffold30142_cov30-Tisochrysis_lutea.AAC.1